MVLFWTGNAGFGHGMVNSDLMGLLLFVTVMILAAGRYYGLQTPSSRRCSSYSSGRNSDTCSADEVTKQ